MCKFTSFNKDLPLSNLEEQILIEKILSIKYTDFIAFIVELTIK